jgi:hypothetical protein
MWRKRLHVFEFGVRSRYSGRNHNSPGLSRSHAKDNRNGFEWAGRLVASGVHSADSAMAKRLVPTAELSSPSASQGAPCVYAAPGSSSEETMGTDRVSLGVGGTHGSALLKLFLARAEENRRDDPAINEHVETVSNLADAAACSSWGPVTGTYFITVQVQRGAGGIELSVWTHNATLTCGQVVPTAREINSNIT